MILAGSLLAGCGQDEAVAHCVEEQQATGGQPEYVKVDDDRCDGHDGSTWIVYSSTYPRAYNAGDRIPGEQLGTKVRSTDAGARAAHGFTRTGSYPARGGFGTGRSGGGSGGG